MVSEQLTFLYEARSAVAVLEAGHELGVFHRLAKGSADATALAEECHLSKRAATALLSALASLGLVEPDGQGAYQMRVDLLGLAELLRPWEGLGQGLRGPANGHLSYPRAVGSIAALFRVAAATAAEHLGSAERVLDLGAGAAPWSLALAARQPSCRVTAVDLAAVLPATRRVVASAGREDQFHLVDGDLFAVELGETSFDLVIAGNLCHLFDECDNRRLFARAAGWLAPGGTMAVIDMLSNERNDGPRAVALHAVSLARRTSGGAMHPFSGYAAWLRDAGFENIERIELTSYPPATLVRARRS